MYVEVEKRAKLAAETALALFSTRVFFDFFSQIFQDNAFCKTRAITVLATTLFFTSRHTFCELCLWLCVFLNYINIYSFGYLLYNSAKCFSAP